MDYKLISICHKGDIVVSQDYGVAAMALGKGAYAIHQSGKWYTNENIDQMLMERHLNKKARINQSTDHSLSGDILFGLGGNLDMASPENEGEGYDGTGSGTENWKPSREAESFYITFDDEGLAEVTWINPCIVEENEGGGVFLLGFVYTEFGQTASYKQKKGAVLCKNKRIKSRLYTQM